ncbi:hypothetical protein EV421DRAFT_1739098 [Armillaria borealis]|uniref:Uncharacterized protein n=1 Tax=Armillaria borealis TaxID=47425 RepID=A0AA39J8G2_9AGAR|nr:hypothetical protein EV421DRAFT_1739098 [Armillaria borealis]
MFQRRMKYIVRHAWSGFDFWLTGWGDLRQDDEAEIWTSVTSLWNNTVKTPDRKKQEKALWQKVSDAHPVKGIDMSAQNGKINLALRRAFKNQYQKRETKAKTSLKGETVQSQVSIVTGKTMAAKKKCLNQETKEPNAGNSGNASLRYLNLPDGIVIIEPHRIDDTNQTIVPCLLGATVIFRVQIQDYDFQDLELVRRLSIGALILCAKINEAHHKNPLPEEECIEGTPMKFLEAVYTCKCALASADIYKTTISRVSFFHMKISASRRVFHRPEKYLICYYPKGGGGNCDGHSANFQIVYLLAIFAGRRGEVMKRRITTNSSEGDVIHSLFFRCGASSFIVKDDQQQILLRLFFRPPHAFVPWDTVETYMTQELAQ